MKKLLVFGVLGFLLAGCSDDEHDDKHFAATKSLYSPNGEPLNGGPLGNPTCDKALHGWFDRLSEGGKGHISALAFLNDANTQFGRMDIDHNGYIVSEELDRFRAPYRQKQPPTTSEDERVELFKVRKKERHSLSDPSLSLSDPVMSADTNLDFKVTQAEFSKQAEETFARLDTNHDGMLDRAEIMTLCQAKEP